MQIYPDRASMIEALVPKGGVYAEIGVFRGDFSRQLLNILSPQKLVLLDLFEGTMGSGNADGNDFQFVDLSEIHRQMIQWNEPVEIRRGDSSSLLATYPDETFDMVYIDGDHSYGGCKRDLDVAWKKVKPGGWIMGHDYEMNMEKATQVYHFGVRQAVDEFCVTHGLEIHAKGRDGCVSYAILRK